MASERGHSAAAGEILRTGRECTRRSVGLVVLSFLIGSVAVAAGAEPGVGDGSAVTVTTSPAAGESAGLGGGERGQALRASLSLPDLPDSAATSRTDIHRSRPAIDGQFDGKTIFTLHAAFHLAQEELRATDSCRALFTRLGADGLAILDGIVYSQNEVVEARRKCGQGIAAFTQVRGNQVRLCPFFATLGTSGGATVLIHEALHSAGLTERPPDPSAMTALEITRMVAKNCGR